MITILTLWMACWWITEYSLLQNFITNTQNSTQNYWLKELLEIFKCWKCTTFTVFIITSIFIQTLFPYAFILSFASMIVTKAIKKFLD